MGRCAPSLRTSHAHAPSATQHTTALCNEFPSLLKLDDKLGLECQVLVAVSPLALEKRYTFFKIGQQFFFFFFWPYLISRVRTDNFMIIADVCFLLLNVRWAFEWTEFDDTHFLFDIFSFCGCPWCAISCSFRNDHLKLMGVGFD